ncbi:tetraacyldisaccharide 4'-kinase [Desulfosarcina sp. OttesenSCG-928-A07]|nr:tetraacyldisaccharide 4'-kinase [Desulfosarcina sp. OttesenSCG-928-G17]MDL2329663.1 tetraacyldisaccharide 4'-kinase [Desulfosarcina sp. OttesenSCG-928-A07]
MNPTQHLRHQIETIIRSAPLQKTPFFSLETLLGLLAPTYGGAVAARAFLYQKGMCSSKKLPCFVISIGNLAVGGTGKTPMTLLISRWVRNLGYKTVVISRGYRGRLEASGGVVSDGQCVLKTPSDAGDEPFLMAQQLAGIPVVVGKDRYQAGLLAIRQFSPDVIVLDDGFQHLGLHRDLDLVLMDARHPVGNGNLMPRGPLREPVSALKRAHGIILTRCRADFPEDDRLFCGKPLFKTSHHQVIRRVPSKAGERISSHTRPLSILKGKKVIAFSGLADNDQFFNSLAVLGCKVASTFSFPDHHSYPLPDMDRIMAESRRHQVDHVVTTAKDAVKIDFPHTFPVDLVSVDVEIKLYEENRFRTFLQDRLPVLHKKIT